MNKKVAFWVTGTFILRDGGRFFKVITVRRTMGNWWTLECLDIDSKRRLVLKYEVLGMVKLLELATAMTKDPKDIVFMDLDSGGTYKIISKEQIDQLVKKGH